MTVDLVTVPRMIDSTVARKLSNAAKRIASATVERDALIVAAHGSGASLREIAEHAGISHVAVFKIVRKAGGGSV